MDSEYERCSFDLARFRASVFCHITITAPSVEL